MCTTTSIKGRISRRNTHKKTRKNQPCLKAIRKKEEGKQEKKSSILFGVNMRTSKKAELTLGNKKHTFFLVSVNMTESDFSKTRLFGFNGY